MKPLARTFALLLVIAALAIQPALAAYAACGSTSEQHTCCMHSAMPMRHAMAGMTAPAQPATVSAECCPPRAACDIRDDSRPQPAPSIAKHSDGSAAISVVEPVLQYAELALPLTEADSGTCARYVLFRVFRI